jgi:hypothetical protein
MRKHLLWIPAAVVLFALTMFLGFSAVTPTASAEVTEFQIKSAAILRPGYMDVTVQSNFSPDSPEGRFVRVSVLDSENHVLDTQKADWANGATEMKTFNFIKRGPSILHRQMPFAPYISITFSRLLSRGK